MATDIASAERDRRPDNDSHPKSVDEQSPALVVGGTGTSLGERLIRAAADPTTTIGAADDPAERAADDTADKVVRAMDRPEPQAATAGGAPESGPMVESAGPTTPAALNDAEAALIVPTSANGGGSGGTIPDQSLQRKTDLGGATERENETGTQPTSPEQSIQHQAEATTLDGSAPMATGPQTDGTPAFSADEQEYLDASQGKGKPLPERFRKQFEDQFNISLVDVGIHDDSAADQAAKSIDALAFALGDDIYFRTGAYDLTSLAGKRLLAHELAHVAQRRPGLNRKPASGVGEAVFRYAIKDGPKGKLSEGTASSSKVTEEADPIAGHVLRQTHSVVPTPAATAIVHEHRQVTSDATQTKADVERFIIEKGWQDTSSWAYRFINADPLSDLKYGGDFDLVKRCRVALRAEAKNRQERVRLLTGHSGDNFSVAPGSDGAFVSEADKETLDLLDRSEAKLNAEIEKYGLKAESSWLVLKDYSMTDGPFQKGIRDNARQLAERRRNVDDLGKEFTFQKKKLDALFSNDGLEAFRQLPGMQSAIEATRKPWMDAETEYRKMCNKTNETYPILAAYSTGDDAAERLRALASMESADLAESLYKTIDERLKNIGKVRSEIRDPGGRYNPWKHPSIIARTKRRLALEPWEARVIDEKAIAEIKSTRDDDHAMVAAAIAIGLGLLSAIPTGGSGLIAGVAAGAAILGTVYSLNTLYEHYRDYNLASAEQLSTLDQAEAISQEDPSLMWLAWDLLDVGIGMLGAAAAFKSMRLAMAGAEVGGLKAVPDLIKATERSGLGVASRSRVVATALKRAGNQSVDQMLKAIRDALAAAKPAPGKEALLDAIRVAAEKLAQRQIARVGGSTVRGQISDIVRALEASDKVVLGDAGKVRNAAIKIAQDFNEGRTTAMYVPKYNIIVLREGEDLVGSLTHEIAHHAQHMERKLMTLGTLRSEFQAHHMEREILLMLPDDMVVGKEFEWLRRATDQQIVEHIMADPIYKGLVEEEAALRPNMAKLDVTADAKMIEDWFLAGSAAK